jgi:hypothetical protein
MDAGYCGEFWEYGSSNEELDVYYRTAAARARRLLGEATTPRLKQHLRELIARFEGVTAKDASASQSD